MSIIDVRTHLQEVTQIHYSDEAFLRPGQLDYLVIHDGQGVRLEVDFADVMYLIEALKLAIASWDPD